MKRLLISGCMVVVLLLSGCVTKSLNGIATQENIVFDQDLVGKWGESDDDSLLIIEASGENGYTFGGKDEEGRSFSISVYLCKINDRMFLDIYPEDYDINMSDMIALHLIRAHTFYLVEQIRPTFKIKSINDSWLKKYLKENPGKIAYSVIDGDVVLTDNTEKLQSFLDELTGIEGAFEEADEMHPLD